MKAPALSIKLDRERSIRFDMAALMALDEVCKFNVLAAGALSNLSPTRIRDLVWAAQLHTEKPLTREKVSKYLPTDMEKLTKIIGDLVEALNYAFTKDTAKAEKSGEDEPAATEG